MSNCYNVIGSLVHLEIDDSLKQDLTCRISADSHVQTYPVPFNEIFCFDISSQTKEIAVAFLKGENEIASGDLVVPSKIESNMEVETLERLKTEITEPNTENKQLVADFKITFINSDMFRTAEPQPQARKSHPQAKLPPKPISAKKKETPKKKSGKKSQRSKNSSVQRSPYKRSLDKGSPVRSRLSPSPYEKQSPGPADRSELDVYLNKVLEKSFNDNKDFLNKDLSDVSDSAYLNKFSQIAKSDLPDPSMYQSGILSRNTTKEYTKIDRTASPERLKERYDKSGKKKRSSNIRSPKPDMESILKDTETRRYVNDYRNQLEYLKSIVYALDLKLRDQGSRDQELALLRSAKASGDAAREELRKSLLETTQDLKAEADKYGDLVQEGTDGRRQLLDDLNKEKQEKELLREQIPQLKEKILQLEGKISSLRASAQAADLLKQQFSIASNSYLSTQRGNTDALAQLAAQVQDLDSAVSKLTADKAELAEEKVRLEKMLAQRDTEMAEEKANNAELTTELENLKLKFQLSQTSVSLLSSVQEHREKILKDLDTAKNQNDDFRQKINELLAQLATRADSGQAEAQKLGEDYKGALERISQLEKELGEFREDNSTLKKENIELRSHIVTLEQLLCVKDDVHSQLQDTNKNLDLALEDLDKLRQQLAGSSKVIEGQEEKIFQLEKCLIYLKNLSEEKDEVNFFIKKVYY